jgi:NadR type nicotinamide-nucleotide adenylyltransferase
MEKIIGRTSAEKLIRVAITGPESSGKTTLARELAEFFNSVYVPEFAREYLENLDRPYNRKDLIAIAEGQLEAEAQLMPSAHRIIFCDTELTVIKIWSDDKFGSIDPELEKLAGNNIYDHYLLCRPDLPWETDPLRENPNDRDSLFRIYEDELKNHPLTIIQGNNRLEKAVAVVSALYS